MHFPGLEGIVCKSAGIQGTIQKNDRYVDIPALNHWIYLNVKIFLVKIWLFTQVVFGDIL